MSIDRSDLAISLVDLSKSYGGMDAVRHVNLDIRAGEFICIMGPSGCGKTTTLRMIAGLETPTGGEIRIAGKVVNDVKPWHREVPLVWQNFVLFPHLTVAENIAYGLKVRKVPAAERRERVTRVLSTIGLAGYENRNVTKLSGGQKQRVGIARALVLNPSILLLDEPLGALDAKIARTMQQELKRLHQALGITFVYVTHNQSEAMALADRIVLMNGGRIEQAGSPMEILRRPASVFVADFIGATNILTARVDEVRDDTLVLSHGLGRFVVKRPPNSSFEAKQPATFVVGVDHMRVELEPSPGENCVKARVTTLEMRGGVVTVLAEAPDGQTFHAHVPSSRYDNGEISAGRELFLTWRVADTHLLP
ncbi:MAG: ABC transporter ATP-binding protein [Parvibaculaceae bacterium]